MEHTDLLFKLKIERLNSIRERSYEHGRLKRLIFRFKKISSENGYWSAFTTLTPLYTYFMFKMIKQKIRSFIKNRQFKKEFSQISKDLHEIDRSENSTPLVYAVKITGGLGDALMISRLIRDFQSEVADGFKFDIYFQSPGLVSFFYENIPGFRKCFYTESYNIGVKGYDFALIANQFVIFDESQFNSSRIIKNFPRIFESYSVNLNQRAGIQKYISAHPFLDGAFSDFATKKGKKRYSFLHEMMGIGYTGNEVKLNLDPNVLEKLKISSMKYITIHDGWDNNFNLATDRPTKALPYSTWVSIVDNIKKYLPEIKIVQLGGKTGADIPGVDFNFRDLISFKESAAVIASSLLHIDAESGLVHLGTSIGTKCLVVFGPTNIDWFGYDVNINIAPKQCGNCWWSSDTWMDSCPLGYKKPICTSTQDPIYISESAIDYLKTLV
ncbi:glycosyltransferase family 9 protein [Dickeya zeae]|uniref:Glycosyltransferase family 9 protein n=1 Tax=Dickeya zeae TaxID=204042 RepID=A0ABX8VWV1_9GAMM|nr:hypothetical protein [Dickeya zeae]QYM92305.1 glycosyltransferase family 9 protein [Dickeya zeae]